MQLANEIQDIWRRGGHEPPRVPYAIRENQIFIVIQDEGTIYRIMDRNGIVYVIAAMRCINIDNLRYECNEPMYSITCKGLADREQFAVDNIIPIVYANYL